MKTARVLSIVVAVAVLAPCLFARGFSKYKDWDQSPQGYFMTKAERAEWDATVKSDDDAEKFINAFLAKRPSTFVQDVADRAAQADKYLTIGKLQGSKTTRGRIVILLGPPQGLDVSTTTVTDTKRDNGTMTDAMTNFGGTGGGGRGDSTSTPGSALSTATQARLYHFTYTGDVAKKVDRNKIDITVEADPNTGKDRIPSRSEASELDLISELAAQNSLKK